MSRSYSNLLDLGAGNFPAMLPTERRVPRVMTVPGINSEFDDDQVESVSSDVSSPVAKQRIIMVANQLPIKAEKRPDGNGWSFNWDEDSLLLQSKDGLPDDMEAIYVGCLKADIDPSEEDDVSVILLENFKCVPAFLSADTYAKYYHGFCKLHLWPLFHYMLPLSADHGGRFDQSLWKAYVAANKIFCQVIMGFINPEDDYIWIHDYHLMVLPSYLRRKCNYQLRIGFFLHCPFPSSEIYRALPVREEILRALLNTDMIGFHTFDYARHFLSCCSRMLGLKYNSERGYMGLEYYGRTVGIKIMPVGVQVHQLRSIMSKPDKDWMVAELRQQFEGKIVLLGVDDMDIFKGINLKLLAMEQLLNCPHWHGRIVLVQIANPARSSGKDLEEIQAEINESCRRINEEFGQPDYKPIVFINRPVSLSERIAYYTIADCVVVTAVRDGMNLIPYEYVVCREGVSDAASTSEASEKCPPKTSMVVVSQFIGCSPSLSGAIRVNPWNIEATTEAINQAISMDEAEKESRHGRNYRYVRSHDVAYWARSFLQDLKRCCMDHSKRRCWGLGFGFSFRVVSLDSNFRKLSISDIVNAYAISRKRAIMLDYDGTLMSQTSLMKAPSSDVISLLNVLSGDLRNDVFIVSGRSRESLGEWFSPCKELGIAAEHGYFLRWPQKEEWEICGHGADFQWMQLAEPVMRQYTESTDGSYIEAKESALVWHHQDADPMFGSAQAKELLDHLESVLANEPVAVRRGQHIVEVKPQGVSKGLVAEKILSSLKENGRCADFVLCIGDDRSDEDMFEGMVKELITATASVFACTVGQKPSKATYYLDDTTEVIAMLNGLAEAPSGPSSSEVQTTSSVFSHQLQLDP